MGFIPIFITLGGFVFLFAMVVHQHFNGKKRTYYKLLGDLHQLLYTPQSTDKTEGSLQSLEQRFHSLRQSGQAPPERLTQASALIKEAKLLRHQYSELRRTKPYSFIAQVMGHSAI
jgi:hypothetical protein